MTVNLRISQKTTRFIAVYLPNSLNYNLNYFEAIFRDIEGLVQDANSKRYAMVMAGDFNLHLNEGDRGHIVEDFCMECSMNGATPCDDLDTCTFKKSWGHSRRLNYILHSKYL